jgi:hypothetical protein
MKVTKRKYANPSVNGVVGLVMPCMICSPVHLDFFVTVATQWQARLFRQNCLE